MRAVFLFLFFFGFHLFSHSQSLYYQSLNDEKIFPEKEYLENLNSHAESVKTQFGDTFVVEENIILNSSTNDSILYFYEWTSMPEELFQERALFRKKFGEKIDISSLQFLNDSQDFDPSKPTFINFWFTNCPPCITEIPALNELKDFYAQKINFVAVTFDNKEKVAHFLTKFDFQLNHIIDAQEFIDTYHITAYPISFILDKDQKLQLIEASLPEKSAPYYEAVINKLKRKLDVLL